MPFKSNIIPYNVLARLKTPTQLYSLPKNGVGAYVIPIRKVVFHFCEFSGSSRFMNEFLKTKAIRFANENPNIEVIVTARPNKQPSIRAYYLNGAEKVISVGNKPVSEILKSLNYLKNNSGYKAPKHTKPVISDTPSVRGIWSPFHSLPHTIG